MTSALPKDQCYLKTWIGNKTLFRCKICGRTLSRKQRILTHLINKHQKSPMKRVYKSYEDDPSVPIPKRTVLRHVSARNRLFGIDNTTYSSSLSSSSYSGDDLSVNLDESDNATHCCYSRSSPTDESITHISLEPTELLDTEQNDEKFSDSSLLVSPGVLSLNASSDGSDESFSVDYNTSSDISDVDLSGASESISTCSDDEFSFSEHSDGDYDNSEVTKNPTDFTETEVQAMCIMSFILRHNLSGVAANDMLKLLPVLLPSFDKHEKLTYEKVLSSSGDTCRAVDYCSVCNRRFPDDPDVFICDTDNCGVYRYKGPFSSQMKTGRQPRSCYLVADVEKQLKYILGRKGVWESVQDVKNKVKCLDTVHGLTDITDGKYYRRLCQPGQFLHDSSAVSGIFNTDGIPLYSSTNVKLWPIFLAINELPPSARFARENMVLAAIWQGKNKPPFAQYMCTFGEEMIKLYSEGFVLNTSHTLYPITVKFGVLLATMDLQAKGYVLNMTMHNGHYGCSTCEEEGETVRQGKGYARSYPYRPQGERPVLRDSSDVKYVIGSRATDSKRIKGICGTTGLASMPWFDIVLGVVPDYMHCILLGVMKNLLHKFFSPTNSDKPYFVGKHLKKIARRMQGICPPDYIERLPRDLEKNYNHFKATELQTCLLFYAIPCLNGFLEEVYLRHLSYLSEAVHLLLGSSITDEELQRAESYLDTFYEQYADLYGKGSCGLNVHNIGAHMVFYVRLWGPLWAWSCFPFEDWNSALLQSVHGTGDVTKQCLRLKEIQLKLSCLDVSHVQQTTARCYLGKMRQRTKLWSCGNSFGNISVAGSLQNARDIPEDAVQIILQETGAQNVQHIKKVVRVKFDGQKLYSLAYTRMKKRLCHIVRCRYGDIRKILFFVVNMQSDRVFAFTHKICVHDQSFICDTIPRHIIRVIETEETEVIPVEQITDKVFLMHIDGLTYITFMPNMIGHGVFK